MWLYIYIAAFAVIVIENSTGSGTEDNESEDDSESGEDEVTTVSNLGKYVRYDVDGDGTIETDDEYESILWRVLRDDEEKVELITADALGSVGFPHDGAVGLAAQYGMMIDLIVSECKSVTGMENNIRSVGRTMNGDDYYEEDWANLTEVGLSTADNGEVYWLAAEWSATSSPITTYGILTSTLYTPPVTADWTRRTLLGLFWGL